MGGGNEERREEQQQQVVDGVKISDLPPSLQGPAAATMNIISGGSSKIPPASTTQREEAASSKEIEMGDGVNNNGDEHLEPMDVVDTDENNKSTEIASVEENLKIVLNSNFDSVTKSAIIIIMKYVVNILANLPAEKYRVINTSNKIYLEKIAPAKGTQELLACIGFIAQRKKEVGVKSVFGANAASAAALVASDVSSASPAESIKLPVRPNDRERLISVHAALHDACIILGVPQEEIPMVSIPSRSEAAAMKPTPAFDFDPMKSHVHRTAPQPHRGVSVTQNKIGFPLSHLSCLPLISFSSILPLPPISLISLSSISRFERLSSYMSPLPQSNYKSADESLRDPSSQ